MKAKAIQRYKLPPDAISLGSGVFRSEWSHPLEAFRLNIMFGKGEKPWLTETLRVHLEQARLLDPGLESRLANARLYFTLGLARWEDLDAGRIAAPYELFYVSKRSRRRGGAGSTP